MVKPSNDKLIETFEEMSLIEPFDFVKLFEGTFDVTTAAPAAVAVAVTPTGEAAAEKEKTKFEVTLESADEKRIMVIKTVRNLTGLDLKEIKDLVDGAPSAIFGSVKKEGVEKAKTDIKEVGGKVTLK